MPRQFTWKLPLHPPEDHPGVAPEASEHEEVDHRVEGRGGLGKQRGRHSVAVGDFLGKGNHFLVTSPWSLREFGISAFVTYLLTEGSVTISQMQRLAKGPQAIRYPTAVVAIILSKELDIVLIA